MLNGLKFGICPKYKKYYFISVVNTTMKKFCSYSLRFDYYIYY